MLGNDSSSPEDDFIRPAPGEPLHAYCPELPALPPASEVTAQLTLLGGPSGSRVVVQDIRPVKGKTAVKP